jgi:16S rRNA processing protein RimM
MNASAKTGTAQLGAGLVLLGRIGAAQGLRGELRITTFTESPENIAAYGPLRDAKGRSFEIETLRALKGAQVVVRLAGVDDRTAAEALNGVELFIDKALLPETEENEWYYEDLIGLKAVSSEGSEIGVIASVQNFGAGDLLEIRLSGSQGTIFLSFTEAAVPDVDIKAGRVIVIMPEEIEAGPEEHEDTPQ